jgi:tetratricopeptide (TPR) repeat protein
MNRKARRAAEQAGRGGSRPGGDVFRAGLAHHQAGRLAEAEALYRQTIAVEPNHADALHLLGVIASQVGRHDVAVELIDLAIGQDARNSLYHSNRGLALQGLGRFAEALASYDRALALRPGYPEALFNRAVSLQALARFEQALAGYDRALAVRPDHAEALSNRGVVLHKLGRIAEAIASYERALATRPTFVEALANRGNALAELGRREEALASYERALAVRPDHADVLFHRGGVLHELGRSDDALESYERALTARPDFAEARFNRAVLLQAGARHEAALADYDRVLALRPDHAEAHGNRGAVLNHLGRLDEAVASYDRAIAARPDYADAWSNRGQALQALRRYEEALASCERALALRPDHAEAWSNRGVVLQVRRRFDEALASYDRALALRPDWPAALNNRANTLAELARFKEAREQYDRALAFAPDYAEAGLNRAFLLLLLGEFEEGWRAYEWRRKTPTWTPRIFAQPEWAGENPSGKTLLLYAEQGFGDTIQFVRYAGLVAARGARVVLAVQPALKELLADSDCAETVVAAGEPLPPFDLHCPLLSLPRRFATTAATIPADTPYIRPPSARVEAWKARLPHGLRVGLAWSGHPSNSKDYDRSIPFEQLAPLLALAGVRFVSLQKDVRASDAPAFAACDRVIDLRAEFNDFSDTAAAIANLDLVITVDTAVAHLAGAMGKPTWILLPYVPDFRWQMDRADSPWYPTARLLRKSAAGDWGEVLAGVARQLGETNSPSS